MTSIITPPIYGDAFHPDLDAFFEGMREAGVAKVSWTIYFEADQSEMYADPIFEMTDGSCDSDLPWPTFEHILWHLSEQCTDVDGEFEIEISTRTVRRVADAWMPEPELVTVGLERPEEVQV